MRSARSTSPTHLVTDLKASPMSKWVWRLAPTPRPSAITSRGEESSHACAMAPYAIWMPAALRPAITVHTPICLPLVTRERSEEHTSELQSHVNLVCRLLLEK